MRKLPPKEVHRLQRSIIAPAERVTNLRWGIALILGFGVLVNYIDRGALSVASKPLHDELGLGPEQFGYLSSAFFVVYAFSQIPIGYILDRYGVTVVSRIAAFLWTIASACTALAPNFALIYTARLFLGLAEAPTFPANAKAVGYWFPRNERGLATSLFDAAAKLSNAVGVAFTAYLLVMFGWRGMFWSTAALSFVFFILFYVFYRNPSEDKRLTHAEAEYIRKGGGEPETPAGERPRGASLAYLLRQRKVWGLTIGFAAYGYLFAFLLTWLPTYLQNTFGVNILKAGGYVFLIWGVGTLTDLIVGGWLVDYLIKRGADANRVRKTVLIAGLVMGFAVIGAAYTKDINVAVAWITVAVAGISFHAPVGWSIPGLIAPTNSTGQVGGIMNFLNNIAGFFAPTITGIIVARTGSFNIALITAGLILVVGIFSYVVILGRIDKIPDPAVA
jgi:MFS transporter, ACS family, D-galactonate transporter